MKSLTILSAFLLAQAGFNFLAYFDSPDVVVWHSVGWEASR
jgi:hypothetical protein